jgi:hypothetical protein
LRSAARPLHLSGEHGVRVLAQELIARLEYSGRRTRCTQQHETQTLTFGSQHTMQEARLVRIQLSRRLDSVTAPKRTPRRADQCDLFR